MSDPDRRTVRVRRSPKVGVFLGFGVLVGVAAAALITVLTPADGQYPTGQVLGFTALLLVPVGAALGALVAIVLDLVATRRARVVEAERVSSSPSDGDRS
jgi:hypothetical protein